VVKIHLGLVTCPALLEKITDKKSRYLIENKKVEICNNLKINIKSRIDIYI
jgi:hypothetical protein